MRREGGSQRDALARYRDRPIFFENGGRGVLERPPTGNRRSTRGRLSAHESFIRVGRPRTLLFFFFVSSAANKFALIGTAIAPESAAGLRPAARVSRTGGRSRAGRCVRRVYERTRGERKVGAEMRATGALSGLVESAARVRRDERCASQPHPGGEKPPAAAQRERAQYRPHVNRDLIAGKLADGIDETRSRSEAHVKF